VFWATFPIQGGKQSTSRRRSHLDTVRGDDFGGVGDFHGVLCAAFRGFSLREAFGHFALACLNALQLASSLEWGIADDSGVFDHKPRVIAGSSN
jgi:hypothetical protein